MIQNRGDFAHFDKKGGPPAREIVARADARENAVGNGQFRLSRRNKAGHLRHQHDERGVPEVHRRRTALLATAARTSSNSCRPISMMGSSAATSLHTNTFCSE